MSGFSALFQWLATFWDWVLTFFKWALDGLLLLLQFLVFTILDGLFTIVETTLAAINLSSVLFNYAASWSSLPPQLVWLINAAGLPQCFALLGAAYMIRLTLNLIPSVFTRV
ncbi:MAG: hypothetical protein LBD10_04615 [Desulfobulbus sp.]|jgi:hypothetical protein|uniref:hypothetical protein n=1 Tax=Desulfobulbus sp. TaxID=895 RepID=UPI002840A8E5|nr:hypothetical protein [Desulfobulbus sp.]MDR2549468.1 hypothetical protein [Desulfobulbus sp.]